MPSDEAGRCGCVFLGGRRIAGRCHRDPEVQAQIDAADASEEDLHFWSDITQAPTGVTEFDFLNSFDPNRRIL